MRMSVHRGDDAGDAFIGMLSGALGAELGKQDAQSRESEFGHYAGRGKNLTAHQEIVVVVTLLKANQPLTYRTAAMSGEHPSAPPARRPALARSPDCAASADP